uniref:Uncharacterized protein n=1 Tax=Ananas comosus var. bracteatus TaxID=296719 RepID=A0A6V7PGJ2_ANACO|nr:unnamed protein product [Ananas comosus var. bracteatus]
MRDRPLRAVLRQPASNRSLEAETGPRARLRGQRPVPCGRDRFPNVGFSGQAERPVPCRGDRSLWAKTADRAVGARRLVDTFVGAYEGFRYHRHEDLVLETDSLLACHCAHSHMLVRVAPYKRHSGDSHSRYIFAVRDWAPKWIAVGRLIPRVGMMTTMGPLGSHRPDSLRVGLRP